MLKARRKSTTSSYGFVWLVYDRTGFTVVRNLSKSPTGLPGFSTRPHGNASASPRKSGETIATACTVVETLDYYPYGTARLDEKAGSYAGEQRKYIGQEYDAQTQLSYLNARYYDGGRGQFTSEDPMFLGGPKAQHLDDPQSLNSYAYAEGNPIVRSDPSGKDSFAPALSPGLGLSMPAIPWVLVGTYGLPVAGIGAIIGLGFLASPYIPFENVSTIDVARNPANPAYPGLPRMSDADMRNLGWPTSPGNLEPPRGNVPNGKKWGSAAGLLTYAICQAIDCVKIAEDQFSQGTGNSNANNGNLSWTQPSPSNQPTVARANNPGGGFSGSQGGGSSGQDPGTYTFNHGVNAHGQTYGQVFPSH